MSNHIRIISFPSILWFVLLLLRSSFSDAKTVPLFFIFGDSLVDAGNNNYLHTIAKANVKPYGIDYTPSGGKPTGRFCNGKTFLDLTVDEFGGSCYPPPSLSLSPDDDGTLCGVNYASSGGGILNDTGALFLERISMDAQIDTYANTRQNMITNLGREKATELLKNAVFPIVVGSNDFLDNFLTPIIGTREYIPQDRLHSLDARFIIIWNVPPIGCMPLERKMNPWYGGKCADSANELVSDYNKKLKDMITELRPNLSEVTLLFVDAYYVLYDLLLHKSDYGIKVAGEGCCTNVGPVVELFPCKETSTYCEDRSKYAFWDEYHPSEFVNRLSVKRYMDGDTKHVLPFNIRRAMKLRGF
ncbi:GDSL esterase/lipase At3g50400-like isoform X2 [Papaver somniferum]|uniref:GDSL esterase/lipase At3g50400-like isoform X2 n=1 Tax=Papaver somniferum TaxID=3469 RepID=UPI000E6F5D9C|nr:GDSL esterase/lipase At3g50400-like isoform X2 [Papaver somniferum]